MRGMIVDYSGRKVGNWTFVRWAPALSSKTAPKPRWIVRCICGTEKTLRADAITCGRSTSCGCTRKQGLTARTPGLKRAYSSWRMMILRCTDPRDDSYLNYGARGIAVCGRWMLYADFLHDMGECPEDHSIERLDVNGNYEPSNCIWLPKKLQARNRRTTHWIMLDGQKLTLSEAALKIGLQPSTLSHRIHSGMPLDRALRLPSQFRKGRPKHKESASGRTPQAELE